LARLSGKRPFSSQVNSHTFSALVTARFRLFLPEILEVRLDSEPISAFPLSLIKISATDVCTSFQLTSLCVAERAFDFLASPKVVLCPYSAALGDIREAIRTLPAAPRNPGHCQHRLHQKGVMKVVNGPQDSIEKSLSHDRMRL
jgi:hypothetical protein